MKKLSALILGLGLLAGSTVNTFAIVEGSGKVSSKDGSVQFAAGDSDLQVNGKISATSVYSVDIEWGNMTFNYTGTWDPSQHEYTDGTWESTEKDSTDKKTIDSGKIRMLNHSNRDITATCKFGNEYGITGKWSNQGESASASDSAETTMSTKTAEGVTYASEYDAAADDSGIKNEVTLKMVGIATSDYLAKVQNKAGKIGTVTMILSDSTEEAGV